MAWQTVFGNVVARENRKSLERKEAAQRALEQAQHNCDDKTIQCFERMARPDLIADDPDDSTHTHVQAGRQAIKGLNKKSDDIMKAVRAATETMHAVDLKREEMLESSYGAELDLQEFEQTLCTNWLEKKRAAAHFQQQLTAVTGMMQLCRCKAGEHSAEEAKDDGDGKHKTGGDGGSLAGGAQGGAIVFSSAEDVKAQGHTATPSESPKKHSKIEPREAQAEIPKEHSEVEHREAQNEFPEEHTEMENRETLKGGRGSGGGDSCKGIQLDSQSLSVSAPPFTPWENWLGEVAAAARGDADSNAPGQDGEGPEGDEQWMKEVHPGSRNHPFACKPCHFQGGLCWKALACSFCHICPKPRRKSKHQRDVDKRRQERNRQANDLLGTECCELLARIDDGRRFMMTQTEELKKQVKEAYQSTETTAQQRESVKQQADKVQLVASSFALQDLTWEDQLGLLMYPGPRGLITTNKALPAPLRADGTEGKDHGGAEGSTTDPLERVPKMPDPGLLRVGSL